MAAGLQAVLKLGGLDVSGGLPVLPRTVIVSVVAGLVVTLLSATLPAMRAARIAPVVAMRDDVATPPGGVVRRGLVGAALVAAGVAIVLPSVNRAIRSTINSEARTHNLSLILDTAFGPTLFNQLRFSYGRTEIDFPEHPSSPFIFQQSSVVGIETDEGVLAFESRTFPIGQLVIEPYSPVGVDVYTFPQGRRNNTFQIADSVSWTAGRHSVCWNARAAARNRSCGRRGSRDMTVRLFAHFDGQAPRRSWRSRRTLLRWRLWRRAGRRRLGRVVSLRAPRS